MTTLWGVSYILEEGEKKWGKSLLPGVTRYALTPGCILSPFQGDFTAYIVFSRISTLVKQSQKNGI